MLLQSAASLAKTAGQLVIVAGAIFTITQARKGSFKMPEGVHKWLPKRAAIHSAQHGEFVPDELSYSHWMS